MKSGRLISIEGIDGAGKTTHARLLRAHLDEVEIRSSFHHFPNYDSRTGELIRLALQGVIEIPLSSLFVLFTANRLEFRDDIRSELASGHVVVMDRYTESELAYGQAHGFPYDWLANLENQMPKADAVILLDLDETEALGRTRLRKNQDNFDRNLDLLRRVRTNYLSLSSAISCPEQQWIVLDSSMSLEVVQSKIQGFLLGLVSGC